MTWLHFTIAALGVYRLSYLIAVETGPFGLSQRFRDLGQRGPDWLAEGVACPLCVSFWLSLPAALLLGGPWPWYWGGISGACLVLHRATEREDE